MHPTRALLCALCLLALPVGGCDAIMSLFDKPAGDDAPKKEMCEKAAVCYEELDDEGVDDELIQAYEKAKGKKPGWPNATKSWAARSEKECKEFLDFATENLAAMKKAHPALNQTRCGGK